MKINQRIRCLTCKGTYVYLGKIRNHMLSKKHIDNLQVEKRKQALKAQQADINFGAHLKMEK